jgi:hypothetical protein
MVAMLKHGKEQTRPSLDKVIAVLKEEGVKFGATGYCFGGSDISPFNYLFSCLTKHIRSLHF